ncbi:SRPBCC family protein [Puia sp. P3]|uniref:SRPBCC family protein n=1 Tax=Puia sp. P3 TaxID=3423952 RepID=UPI003D67D718
MKSIRQNVLIAAPAEKVYRALTTQEGLAGWWTPAATARAEVNSIARFPFNFPDFEYAKEMKVTVLKNNARVEWECIAGADEWIGTTISFTLEAGDKATLGNDHPELLGQLEQQQSENGTLVIFEHNGWKEYTPQFSECSFTWGQFLRSLKRLCETGKGQPWPNQYQ